MRSFLIFQIASINSRARRSALADNRHTKQETFLIDLGALHRIGRRAAHVGRVVSKLVSAAQGDFYTTVCLNPGCHRPTFAKPSGIRENTPDLMTGTSDPNIIHPPPFTEYKHGLHNCR